MADGDPSAYELTKDRFEVGTDVVFDGWTAPYGLLEEVRRNWGELQEYIEESWLSAKELFDDINENWPGFIGEDYEYNWSPQVAFSLLTPTAPEAPDIEITLPDEPQKPTLEDADIEDIDVPSLTATPPDIQYPDEPTVTWPTPPGDAPVIGDVEFPAKPDYTLPAVPVLDDIPIASAPVISIPTFEETLPDFTIDPPVSTFMYDEAEYQSDLGDALDAQLLADVNAGASGLGAEAEDAIYQRGRDRRATEDERIRQEIDEYFEARGWALPPGAMAGRHQEMLNEQSRANDQLNYEIIIQESKLAYEDAHFIINASIEREKGLLAHSNEVAQRAFLAAQYTQEAAIKVFNAQVAHFNAELDSYKTAAAVHESKIRAVLLEMEKYKAELEGAKLRGDIQEQEVRLYAAQLGGIEVILKIYAAEMQAANIKAQVEATRIEGFRATVEAYTARIKGNIARYNAYEAQIAGEVEKAKVYESQVKAYMAEASAAEAKAKIYITQGNFDIEVNRFRLEEYKTDMTKYATMVDAEVKEAGALATLYDSQVRGYGAEINFAGLDLDRQVKEQTLEYGHIHAQFDLAMKQYDTLKTLAVEAHRLAQGAFESITKIKAQLAASMASSISAQAQVGYRVGFNHNYGTNTNTNYNYSYSG